MRLFRSLLSNLSRSATHHHGKVGAKVNGNGIVNANVNVNVPVPARRFAQVHDVRIEYEDAPARTQDMASLNVFKQPLALHSTKPMTGYMRNGYCEAPKSDQGNHSVAGIVTDEFLDYSAAQGNDLRQVGLTDGCKWCLCVSRWKEAFDNRTGDNDKKVPKIVLKATNQRALEGIRMEDLKKFAVDKE